MELDDGEVALASDLVQVRLAGASGRVFTEDVLRRLDGTQSLDDLMQGWSDQARVDALALVDRLVGAGVIEPAKRSSALPMMGMLDALGVGADGAAHLSGLTVAIVGTEGPGAHVAALLAATGIGSLVLVDPYPCSAGDVSLWPAPVPFDATGRPRQDLVAGMLSGSSTSVRAPLADTVGKTELMAALEDADLVVHTFDRGFASSALWVNEFALQQQRPALFGRLTGQQAVAGPFVFPGEGPCYLCSRMRTLACVDDFGLEMALEEQLDHERSPDLAGQPTFPALSAMLGSLLALELTKSAVAVGRPSLAAHVAVVDALAMTIERHAVLQNPQCAACRKKGRQPGRVDRHASPVTGSGLTHLRPLLVSRRTGIVRSLAPVPRDTTEPAWPHVVRAELSNHRFVNRSDDPFEVCSGKGVTFTEAETSALGEACERYAGARADPARVIRAARSAQDRPSLGPDDLVLFAREQYSSLPYAPWDDDAPRDWIAGVDLRTGDDVLVPLIAVLMHHAVRTRDEFIAPITSNGLAAGPTAADAVAAAALEVIERDAFVVGWMQRLPARRLPVAAVADGHVRELTEAYQRRGVLLELYVVPTDAPATVVVSVAVDREDRLPAAVVGLGCDLDLHVAARKAALEIGQVRPALKARLRDPAVAARLAELVADPGRVADLEDHDLLYAHPVLLPQLDVWRGTSELEDVPDPLPAMAGEERVERLVAGLHLCGTTVVAVDLTAPELGALGVHCARAIVPGFQPIHFGTAEARLGGRRIFDLPARLGLQPRATTPAGLFALPHPLS